MAGNGEKSSLEYLDYRLEYIRLLLGTSQVQGLAAWVKTFMSALDELEISQCKDIVQLTKSYPLSSNGKTTIIFHQGLMYSEQQKWSDALDRFNKCLKMRRSLQDQVGTAEVLFQIGHIYRHTSNYTEARGSLLTSLVMAESLEEASLLSNCLRTLAQVFEVQGEYEAAQTMYAQSLELDDNPRGRAQTRYRLGLIAQIKGDYATARQNYKSALTAINEANSRPKRMLADLEYQLGISFYEQGDLDEAEEHFKSVLVLLSELEAPGITQGRALQGLGMIHQARGDQRDVLMFYEGAEALFEEFVSQEGAAGVLLQKGLIELDRNGPDVALSHFERARDIFKKLGHRQGMADAYHGLGKAYSHLRSYSRALDHFQLALSEYRSMGNRLKTAQVLYELGRLLSEQGATEAEAEEHLKQALRISRRIESKPVIADCMLALGRLNHERGDIEEARYYYYAQSLALYQQMNLKPKVARTLFQMAQLYNQIGQQNTAHEHYLNSVDTALAAGEQKLALEALQQLELMALLSKQYANARQYFEQAQQIVETKRKESQDG